MGGDKGNAPPSFMQNAVGVGGGYNPYANSGGQYGGGMRDPIRQRPGPPSFMQNTVGVGGGYNPYANSGGGGMISPPSVWNPQPRGPGGRPRNSPFYPPTPRYSISDVYGQPGPPSSMRNAVRVGGGYNPYANNRSGGASDRGMQRPRLAPSRPPWYRPPTGWRTSGMQQPDQTTPGGDVNGTGKMSAARAAYANSLGSADPMAAAKAAYATGGGAAAMAGMQQEATMAPADPMAAAKAAYATGGGAAAMAAMQEAQAAAAPDPQSEFVPQQPYHERMQEQQAREHKQRQAQFQQYQQQYQQYQQQQQQQQRPWQLFNNGGLVRGYQDGGPVGAPPQDDAMAMLRQALMSEGLGGAMGAAGGSDQPSMADAIMRLSTMGGAAGEMMNPEILAEIAAQQGGGREMPMRQGM